jgi:hypothetical protein
MLQTPKRSFLAAALAVLLLLAPVFGAAAAPRAGEARPWGWVSGIYESIVHVVAGNGDAAEAEPSMDPNGLEADPDTDPDGAEAGPSMDPDGYDAGPGMDPNGGSVDVGSGMDPNG